MHKLINTQGLHSSHSHTQFKAKVPDLEQTFTRTPAHIYAYIYIYTPRLATTSTLTHQAACIPPPPHLSRAPARNTSLCQSESSCLFKVLHGIKITALHLPVMHITVAWRGGGTRIRVDISGLIESNIVFHMPLVTSHCVLPCFQFCLISLKWEWDVESGRVKRNVSVLFSVCAVLSAGHINWKDGDETFKSLRSASSA